METTAKQLMESDLHPDTGTTVSAAYIRMFTHAENCEILLEKTRRQLALALKEVTRDHGGLTSDPK